MIGYELPTSLVVGGVEYYIRTDFRAILDVLIAMNDPELDQDCRGIVMLQIIYKDYDKIPEEHLEEALQKASDFIDCGQAGNGKARPKTIDWEQDAGIIIPAINNVAHKEVRALEYLHWWTFLGYFMEIKEGIFSTVVSIRQKKSGRKKLEKWEKEFYLENKQLIDFTSAEPEEIKKEKEDLLKWL